MNRTGLVITLAVAATVGLIFGIWPELDLKFAAPLYDPGRGGFFRAYEVWYLRARDTATWLITLAALPAVVALVVKFVRPRWPLLVPGRAIILILLTLGLGPGVVANLIFKEHWGRPRPIDVTEFGGDEHFRAWWDPRGDCPKNCSFVGGEASGAFWTLAPAAVVPVPWRAAAYGLALAFGAGVSALRMAAGAHFFTDVVFAGVFVFLVIWLVHGSLYRWPRTRITDEEVEKRIERLLGRKTGGHP